jgi:hypothetical protein
MAALGMTPEDYPDNGVECWELNLHALTAFTAMDTQWRIAASGHPIGLDYAALPAVLRLSGIPRAAWPDTFDALRVMESEAIVAMNEAKT